MSNDKTILTLESYGKKFSAEMNQDTDLYTIMDSFAGLLVGATFPYQSVVDVMYEWSKNQREVYHIDTEED